MFRSKKSIPAPRGRKLENEIHNKFMCVIVFLFFGNVVWEVWGMFGGHVWDAFGEMFGTCLGGFVKDFERFLNSFREGF